MYNARYNKASVKTIADGVEKWRGKLGLETFEKWFNGYKEMAKN